MAVNEAKLAEALVHVLNTRGEWVDFESLCHALMPEIGRKRITDALREEVDDMLESDAFRDVVLIRPSSSTDSDDEYIARWHFFEGARFLVSLTPFEQEKRVLIPGHRFFPFIQSGWAGEAVLRYKGKPLKTTKAKLPFDDTRVYHTLLGQMGWSVYLSQDNSREAIESAAENNGMVELTVFDLTPIFEDVRDPQQMLLQCRNYNEREIDIVEVPDGVPVMDFQAVNAAVAQLDAALVGVFEEYGPDDLILPEQIAYAYARMPDWFFDNPPFHFGGYLNMSDQVQLADGSLETILWFTGREPEEDSDVDVDSAFEMVELMAKERGVSPQEFLQYIFQNGPDEADELFAAMDGTGPGASAQNLLEKSARRNLQFKDQVLRLKVSLDGNKDVYRIIDVHSVNTWHDLHFAIFQAFDRYDAHLFSFFFPGKPTKSERKRMEAPEIGCPEQPGGTDDAECTMIGEVSLKKGANFYYLFDWGDCWWHEIKVESITDAEADDEYDYPIIVKSVGPSPDQY